MGVTVHHTTSQPRVFVGRAAELALLDAALTGGGPSVVAFVGPGGQGKTAILQLWLGRLAAGEAGPLAGVFFWSTTSPIMATCSRTQISIRADGKTARRRSAISFVS